MMILISGQPGNGKTLRAMALAHEEYERNREGVKAGKEKPRRFFTNIAGATLAENPQAFDWFEAIPEHNDWRELPDGSYVVYDEAHADGQTQGLERYGLLFPGTGKPGEAQDPRIKAMSTHRHRGFDLVFVTQWPSKVHHTLRQLVGKHIHMNRAMGLQRAGVLTWSRVQPDPYDESQREKAEEEIWAFDQALYGRYRSATLHTATYKFKIPRKAWQALSMLVMIFLVGWLLWLFVFKPVAKAEPSSADEAAIGQTPLGVAGQSGDSAREDEPRWETSADYAKAHLPRFASMPWTAPIFDERQVTADPQLLCMTAGAGVDANGEFRESSCRCVTEQNTRYDMPDGECRAMARNGPVYNPYKQVQQSAGFGGVGGMPPTAMAAPAAAPSPGAVIPGDQVSGYGDIGVGNGKAAPR